MGGGNFLPLLLNFYFFRLQSFLPFSSNVTNELSFLQSLEPISLDCFEMNEEVIAAILRRYETKPLFIVEPLDRAILSTCHVFASRFD